MNLPSVLNKEYKSSESENDMAAIAAGSTPGNLEDSNDGLDNGGDFETQNGMTSDNGLSEQAIIGKHRDRERGEWAL